MIYASKGVTLDVPPGYNLARFQLTVGPNTQYVHCNDQGVYAKSFFVMSAARSEGIHLIERRVHQ